MKRTVQFFRTAAGAAILSSALISVPFAQNTKVAPAVSKPADSTTTQAVKLKPQSTCPVYGEAINKTLYADVKGKRIYVCCAACISEVKKDPEKYIKKLTDKGEGVETIAVPKAVVPAQKKSATVDTSKKDVDHSKMDHMNH